MGLLSCFDLQLEVKWESTWPGMIEEGNKTSSLPLGWSGISRLFPNPFIQLCLFDVTYGFKGKQWKTHQ